jgi:GINS complex subunit 2
LKRRKKAIVVPPVWLTVDALTEALRSESTQPGFSPLPHFWIGVSQALLTAAPDDIPNSNKVRTLLKDIREARQSKILAGVSMLNSVHLQMTNISAHEIAELRGFFGTAFTHLKALRTPSEIEREEKLMQELDERNRWMLERPAPLSVATFSVGHQGSYQPASRAPTSNTSPADDDPDTLQDSFSLSSPSVPLPYDRASSKSNVSDSGYYSAQHEPHQSSVQRSTAPRDDRPPRFAVDADDDD